MQARQDTECSDENFTQHPLRWWDLENLVKEAKTLSSTGFKDQSHNQSQENPYA
jgi:hypothetical protein